MRAGAEWEMQDFCERMKTTTQTKVINAIRQLKLDRLPDDIKRVLDNQTEIKQDAKKSASILKSVASIFAWGGDEMKRHKEK